MTRANPKMILAPLLFSLFMALAAAAQDANNALGAAAYGEADYAEAEKHFREALKIAPDVSELHFNLGLALQKGGNDAEAASEFQRAKNIGADKAAAPGPATAK